VYSPNEIFVAAVVVHDVERDSEGQPFRLGDARRR